MKRVISVYSNSGKLVEDMALLEGFDRETFTYRSLLRRGDGSFLEGTTVSTLQKRNFFYNSIPEATEEYNSPGS